MPILPRDDNRIPYNTDQPSSVEKTLTFDGTVGAVGTTTLFTLTGEAYVKVFGVCTENLAGTDGSASIGVLGNLQTIIPNTLLTDIDNGDLWRDAAPDIRSTSTVVVQHLVVDDSDILLNISGTAVGDGIITFHCLFQPVSEDGDVIAA